MKHGVVFIAVAVVANAAFATAARPSIVNGSKWNCNYDEAKIAPYALEDPLTFIDGRKVNTAVEWRKRRAEILGIFAKEMYGLPPPAPEEVITETLEQGVTLGGFAIRRQIRMWFKKDRSGPYLDWLMLIPRHEKKPVPVIMGLNYRGNHELIADKEVIVPDNAWIKNDVGAGITEHRPVESARGRKCSANERSVFPADMILARGYALMTACYGQVAPDPVWCDRVLADRPEPRAFTGVFSLWGHDPKQSDGTGTLGAWAWALSRGLDLVERTEEVDARKCVVSGYSRLAKAALLAAARDERFAVCVPVQCGAGGVQLLKRDFGETVAIICRQFPHWFCPAYQKYADNEENMPFDQHLLLATIAPRPLLVLGFDERWYDTKGEWLSCRSASPVWDFLGVPGLPDVPFPADYCKSCVGTHLAYIRRTERHGISAYDWTWMMDFADRYFEADGRRGGDEGSELIDIGTPSEARQN